MSTRMDFAPKTAKKPTMRPLVIKDLPETVQLAIKKRAWRDDISYEAAVAELLHDAEIERIVQHELALRKRLMRLAEEEEDDDDPF